MSAHKTHAGRRVVAGGPVGTPVRVAWNWMVLEYQASKGRYLPFVGPGALTRGSALAEVQAMLNETASFAPGALPLLSVWRRGAKDDTVFHGLFVWTVYRYDSNDQPEVGAHVWLEDFADRARRSGSLGR